MVPFIEQLYQKLTQPLSGSFSISITKDRSFHYLHQLPNPEIPQVLDSHVPILEPLQPETNSYLIDNNLIIAALLPHMNGKKHVKSISKASGIDIEICKMTI